MKVDCIIDWLSVTAKNGMWNHPHLIGYGLEREKGLLGYTSVFDMPDGRVVMRNPNRADMGTHVQYSGTCMALIRDKYKTPDMEVIKHHWGHNHKVTRIDLAVDVFGEMPVSKAVKLYEGGECVTGLRTGNEIRGINKVGATLYLGARGGAKMIRIYDKAAEQKVNGNWTRVELEARKGGASKVVSNLMSAETPEKAIQGCVRAVVDFPSWDAWAAAITAKPQDMKTSRKVAGNTERWLKDKVAPSLAKFAVDHPGWIDEYMHYVSELMQEIVG